MVQGLPGKQTRGLPTAARLTVADNSGAKVVQIISVLRAGSTLRRYPAGGVGDMIRVSVKKGNPETRRQMYDGDRPPTATLPPSRWNMGSIRGQRRRHHEPKG